MLVDVSCSKCGRTFPLDIGEKNRDEVEHWMDMETLGWECPGHHVEMTARSYYWTPDWGTLREGQAPSEEDIVNSLKEKYHEVYGNQELYHSIYEITAFAYGLPIARRKDNGEKVSMNFVNSPETRYYFVSDGCTDQEFIKWLEREYGQIYEEDEAKVLFLFDISKFEHVENARIKDTGEEIPLEYAISPESHRRYFFVMPERKSGSL